MRILIANENFYPAVSGTSISSERLATKLANRGHHVIILAPSPTRSLHIEKRKGYIIYRIPSWPNPFRKGLRFTVAPYRHIAKIFAEEKPDIVHLNIIAPLSYTTLRLARKNGIPIINTNHFNPEWILHYLPFLRVIHPLVTKIMQGQMIRFYNLSTIITVPTETTKQRMPLQKMHVPIEVISNGVDIERFSQCESTDELYQRYALKPDEPLIAYVGRVDVDKNLATLLQAVAELAKTHQFQLVLLGSGNVLKILQEEAKNLAIAERIVWISGFDNDSTLLNQLYHAADIFCIPCPLETESMVTMEAMAAGLPIIAANGGALPELVRSGENGYLVEPFNAHEWREALATLLDDSELRKKMGKQSQINIETRDLSVSVDRFEELYQEQIRLGYNGN